MIVGRPGSGKTTLSVKLAQKFDLPLIHLDRIFWKEGWTEMPRDEFDEVLSNELKKDRWIIDGNYGRTIPLRLEYADTVICFDYPRLLCIWRVLKRVIQNYGKNRFDMGNGCPERFDFGFIKFVWKCPSSYEKIKNFKGDIILIRNKKDYNNYFGDL